MTKNNKEQPKRIPWNDMQYVINNLPAQDLEIAEAMVLSQEDIDDFMTTQIEAGGEFKFNWDYQWGDCPTIKLQFPFEDYKNSGYAVSARHESFTMCIKILIYKFEAVAKSELFALVESKKRSRFG